LYRSARISVCLTLALTLAVSSGWAQDTTRVKMVVIDTVVVTSNSFVLLPDSVFFTDRDTVIYVVDTIRSNMEAIIKGADLSRDSAFYQEVKRRMDRGRISRQLFDALFDLQGGAPSTAPPRTPRVRRGTFAQGSVVGDIRIKKLDVFGPSVTDTTERATRRLSRFYNALHTNTHNRVLRNNLLLRPGDSLTATHLADSERIIRSLPFIRDARLLVQPRANGSDTVDLLLITEDVIPYSFSGRPRGWIEGSAEVSNRNILGTGHELANSISIDSDLPQQVGYEGVYRLPNIRGSFVEANLRYANTYFNEIYQVAAERPFYVPDIRFAGGADINYQRRLTFAPEINAYAALDTFTDARDIPRIRYSAFEQDYWLARSFKLNSFDDRTRLSVSVGGRHQHFYERPPVSPEQNPAFHHRTRLLAGVTFSKRYFTTEELVYTYGRTEDIPVGQLAELVVGPEFGEYNDRWFTGLSYARGNYVTPLGYVSVGAGGGGFWRNRRIEEGVLQFTLDSYSYLFYARRSRFRFFFNSNYTRGIRRLPTIDFQNRYISIRRDDGIRGLSNVALEGNERLTFSLEGVAYPPWNLYSFRLALFGFLDTGLIAEENERLFQTRAYHGIGLGFRVRNENLAFKTFQVRMVVYPNAPPGESWIGFSAGGIPLPRLRDFVGSKPRVFPFE
jgi:hypothetical protein